MAAEAVCKADVMAPAILSLNGEEPAACRATEKDADVLETATATLAERKPKRLSSPCRWGRTHEFHEFFKEKLPGKERGRERKKIP